MTELSGEAESQRRTLGLATLVRWGLLLAPWAFIAYLFRDVDAVADAFSDASIGPMLGGLALTLAGLMATAWLWTRLVGHLSRGVAVPDTPQLLRSFARSWLARYLPGKVWSYGARILHTGAEVTPRRIVASSLVDEFALMVASGTVLGLSLWVWAAAGAAAGIPILVVGMAAVVAAIGRLDRLVGIALRLAAGAMPQRWRAAAEEMQRAADDPGLGVKASALFAGGYLLVNFTLSAAFVLIVVSLADIDMADLPLLIGGYSLAAVIGIVAFIAPAGLGVREGVLAGFLTPLVGGPVAASLAVLVRVVVVLADAVFLALMEVISHFSPRVADPWPAGDERRAPVETPTGQARR